MTPDIDLKRTKDSVPARRVELALTLTMILGAASALGEELDPLAAGWKGERVCEILHEDSINRILRCTFPPGTGHERHYHVPHFEYIVSGGTMQMTDERGTFEVDVPGGESYLDPGVVWHQGLNVGATTVVVLMVEPKP